MIKKWLIVVFLAGSVHAIDTKMKIESTWMMASDGVIATGVGFSGGIIAKKYNCIEILAILQPYALLAADDVALTGRGQYVKSNELILNLSLGYILTN